MKHVLDFEKPILELQDKLAELRKHPERHLPDLSIEEEIALIEKKLEDTRRQVFTNLTAWQRVQLARHPKRPYSMDYLRLAFDEFHELHGDRQFSDDNAMVGGFAMIGGHRCMVVATQKGRDTKENILRNFGSAHPEGYRKALRLMQLANKFKLPIITLVDTAGAYPGIGAEERHIAEAIAVNLREMTLLEVPIITAVIGEGGSGGALGIGVADRVLVLENAYYSVISPEGCAAILWKDRSAASKAAEALKITATHLLDLGLVDDIVPEPLGGAHTDAETTSSNLREHLIDTLESLQKLSKEKLLKQRYEKYRALGKFKPAKTTARKTAARAAS
jgi:acetyl-CoA carboxylase carboxyl transferase subunit alpha